jgi:ferrous iron transport protein B
VVLVGNPNVGKSVLFHRLTGKYATVSNFPGTTVELARGPLRRAEGSGVVTDTPGVNSLLPSAEDERVTRDVLLRERPDVVVNVLDAKNLRRSLLVTLELAAYRIPMVAALNLSDEAADRGIVVDAVRLEKELGIPVVKTVALTGVGVPELKSAIPRARVPAAGVDFPPEVEGTLEKVRALFDGGFPARDAVAQALLSGDDSVLTWSAAGPSCGLSEAHIYKSVTEWRSRFYRPVRQLLFSARDARSARIVAETVTRREARGSSLPATLGRWAMRPWPGIPLALAVLYGVYQFVGVFGAGTAVDFLENTVFGAWITPAVTRGVNALLPWAWARDMLVGPYGVVSMAFSYAFALIFPIVTTFFIAFGLLEDSGYLPRLSVLLDRVFRLMGLNGKAVLPVLLGLGCDTMATMTTRILDTPKERMIVTMLLSLSIPCSAQLAVILGMSAGLSYKILLLWGAVVVTVTLVGGAVTARWVPGARSGFVLEIPPLRRPSVRNIFQKMKVRLTWYLKEVVPLFVWGTLLLFGLDRLGALRVAERVFAPVVQTFLGLPAEATQAFLVGFLRRDYGAAGLYHLQKIGALSLRQTAVSLVLITLFMPCFAQWLMVIKERGWKSASVITGVVLGSALLVAGLLNAVLARIPFL